MIDDTENPQAEPQHPVELSFVERYRISPVLFAFLCLVAVFILYQLVGGFLTLLFVGGKVTAGNVMMQRLFTMVGQILLILLPTLFFARLLDRHPSRVFPWRMPGARETLFAVLSLLFLQEVLQIYLFFQDRIPLPQSIKDVVDPARAAIEEMFRLLVSAGSVPELIFVVIVVAMTPAIIEELLFRGLVQTSFARSLPPVRAAVWTGIIFGIFHFNPFAVVPLMALGVFFAILRMRSRTMILPMTVHFLNNGLAVVISYFHLDDKMVVGAESVTDPNIPSVLSQLFLFTMLFVAAYTSYLRSTKDHPPDDSGRA